MKQKHHIIKLLLVAIVATALFSSCAKEEAEAPSGTLSFRLDLGETQPAVDKNVYFDIETDAEMISFFTGQDVYQYDSMINYVVEDSLSAHKYKGMSLQNTMSGKQTVIYTYSMPGTYKTVLLLRSYGGWPDDGLAYEEKKIEQTITIVGNPRIELFKTKGRGGDQGVIDDLNSIITIELEKTDQADLATLAPKVGFSQDVASLEYSLDNSSFSAFVSEETVVNASSGTFYLKAIATDGIERVYTIEFVDEE